MNILRMTTPQHRRLDSHLFPGDGKEAVAVALCGRGEGGDRSLWTVHQIVEIPYEECIRSPDAVTWPTRRLKALLSSAGNAGMGILKIHSHPSGYDAFSDADDRSDVELFEAVARRLPGEHVSAVMLPDGRIFARMVNAAGLGKRMERVSVVGDDLVFWDSAPEAERQDFDLRHRQMFGDRTTNVLATLSVAVVGVSGTGSPTVEMLMRLGVGRIVLVEPDHVEAKNLNRIYGAKRGDADAKRNKAEMMRDHVLACGLGTVVEICPKRVDSPEAIALLSTCDIVIGCVDSVEGRDALNRIATFYSLPYFDLGVRLDADGEGGVASVSAAVHFLQPGGSSLRSRGVYTEADLYAEYLRRTDPSFYEDQVRRGYVRGVRVDRPAVISINTAVSAAAVNELLARIHPYRTSHNREFAIQKLLFAHGRTTHRPDGEPDPELAQHVGRGTCRPLLMLPRLDRAA
ncbi:MULTISPECIES: HesA/MoeB/ThiF family protein [unclassified Bradyrhizobium]|uniref:HesA/MoeB/ThiF family protein n=1 Tax=Bradyrhizobium sp. USDA 4541 TaxID=2817704 RepID=UPI0020A4A434|nr:ThiF family adenylyltransferase [Bradyrhizobium sp. USDA 4541]MCP1848111.1 hypothetical protein [Bradyrhizobium sp. USDA 4541]